MNKAMKIFAFFLLFSHALMAADSIEGFWKTVNEDGVAQCIIAVYEYGGKCYGRIIATYGEDGKIDDSIYTPSKRAPGVVGDPFYSGLDIIWDLLESKWAHKGFILDPEHGKVYKAELWTDAGNLIVRGKLLMFGRNQTWYPVTKEDIPVGFKLPDPKTFVPSIPETK